MAGKVEKLRESEGAVRQAKADIIKWQDKCRRLQEQYDSLVKETQSDQHAVQSESGLQKSKVILR